MLRCWRPLQAGRRRAVPCGSCGRPAARCRSTERSGPASECSSPASTPNSSPRSPCSLSRGDLVLRHRGTAQSGRYRSRHRGRHRTCHRPSGAVGSRRRRTSEARCAAGGAGIRRGRPVGSRTGRDRTDRFRRSALHVGLVPRRRRTQSKPREDESADAFGFGDVALVAGQARGHHHHVSAGAARGRCGRRSAVRLVGRGALARRLP